MRVNEQVLSYRADTDVENEVFHVKQHTMRLVDDRPVTLKHKKPGDGRSKSPQFGRR